jgi:hypothetical protein
MKSWIHPALGLCLVTAALCGCSHSSETIDHEYGFTRVFAPQPPAFLSGPAAVLLTNSAGFSSRVELHTETFSSQATPVTGQLLGRGSKFFFAPDPNERDKNSKSGGFSFIWDVASQSGLILSDALQAYAPVSYDLRATNVAIHSDVLPQRSISGHPCLPVNATVQMSDGSAAIFQVSRAADLNGLPVQISSVTNAVPLTLTLSKVRLESLPLELFGPPDGFTKYSSAETMVDELAARQHNLRRKDHSGPVELPDSPSSPNGPSPNRRY